MYNLHEIIATMKHLRWYKKNKRIEESTIGRTRRGPSWGEHKGKGRIKRGTGKLIPLNFLGNFTYINETVALDCPTEYYVVYKHLFLSGEQ